MSATERLLGDEGGAVRPARPVGPARSLEYGSLASSSNLGRERSSNLLTVDWEGGQENQEDLWLWPADSKAYAAEQRWRRQWDVLAVAGCIALGLCGLSIIFQSTWEGAGKPPAGQSAALPGFALPYIVATITIEIFCLSLTALGLVAVGVLFGGESLRHALSMFSVANRAALTVGHLLQSAWGARVLWRLLHLPLPLREFDDRLLLLTGYVAVTTAIATLYTLSRLPTIIGVIRFAAHQFWRKFQERRGTLDPYNFQPGDDNFIYLATTKDDAYTLYVRTMPNPVEHARSVVAALPPNDDGSEVGSSNEGARGYRKHEAAAGGRSARPDYEEIAQTPIV